MLVNKKIIFLTNNETNLDKFSKKNMEKDIVDENQQEKYENLINSYKFYQNFIIAKECFDDENIFANYSVCDNVRILYIKKFSIQSFLDILPRSVNEDEQQIFVLNNKKYKCTHSLAPIIEKTGVFFMFKDLTSDLVFRVNDIEIRSFFDMWTRYSDSAMRLSFTQYHPV